MQLTVRGSQLQQKQVWCEFFLLQLQQEMGSMQWSLNSGNAVVTNTGDLDHVTKASASCSSPHGSVQDLKTTMLRSSDAIVTQFSALHRLAEQPSEHINTTERGSETSHSKLWGHISCSLELLLKQQRVCSTCAHQG